MVLVRCNFIHFFESNQSDLKYHYWDINRHEMNSHQINAYPINPINDNDNNSNNYIEIEMKDKNKDKDNDNDDNNNNNDKKIIQFFFLFFINNYIKKKNHSPVHISHGWQSNTLKLNESKNINKFSQIIMFEIEINIFKIYFKPKLNINQSEKKLMFLDLKKNNVCQ